MIKFPRGRNAPDADQARVLSVRKRPQKDLLLGTARRISTIGCFLVVAGGGGVEILDLLPSVFCGCVAGGASVGGFAGP